MVNGVKMKETNKVFQAEKKAQSLSGSSPQGGGPKQLKFESTSESRSSPHQNDAHVAYGVCFRLSLYGWKDNFKELRMALVSGPNSLGVNGNHRNNVTS